MAGLYFEDFKVGDKFVTPSRTVTETDCMNFVGLAGTFNPLFIDEEFAKTTIYGTRIVPGPLTYIISVGLWVRTGLFEGTVMAFLGLDKQRAYLPVHHGDTLHCKVEILSARETSKPDRGIVTARHIVLNQRDEKVMDMEMTYMMKRKS